MVVNSKALHSCFLRSVTSGNAPHGSFPEVAFAGRSNSGKSSSLNLVTGSKLARVSKTPGRTRLLNFFTVQQGGYLVDLPGYGYAKASKKTYIEWQKNVSHYLQTRSNLAGLMLIVDCRLPLQELDQNVIKWCLSRGLPMHILINKIDKFGAGRAARAVHEKKREINALGCTNTGIQAFSALRRHGLDEARHVLRGWLQHD